MRYIKLGEIDYVQEGDMFVERYTVPTDTTKRIPAYHKFIGLGACHPNFYPAWRVWRAVDDDYDGPPLPPDHKNAAGYPKARIIRLPGNWVNANPLPLP